MKLPVPYYSQYIDVQDPFWMLRSCTIVCLKMILEFFGENISLVELIEKGKNIEGYGLSGWIHDKIIELANEYDFDAHREEKMDPYEGIKKIQQYLDKGNPVIVSVIKYTLEQTKFHSVLIVGYEQEGGSVKGFYYYDTESTDKMKGQNHFVDIDTFLGGWRKMALFIDKKGI